MGIIMHSTNNFSKLSKGHIVLFNGLDRCIADGFVVFFTDILEEGDQLSIFMVQQDNIERHKSICSKTQHFFEFLTVSHLSLCV
jgi:hypothetical protein